MKTNLAYKNFLEDQKCQNPKMYGVVKQNGVADAGNTWENQPPSGTKERLRVPNLFQGRPGEEVDEPEMSQKVRIKFYESELGQLKKDKAELQQQLQRANEFFAVELEKMRQQQLSLQKDQHDIMERHQSLVSENAQLKTQVKELEGLLKKNKIPVPTGQVHAHAQQQVRTGQISISDEGDEDDDEESEEEEEVAPVQVQRSGVKITQGRQGLQGYDAGALGPATVMKFDSATGQLVPTILSGQDAANDAFLANAQQIWSNIRSGQTQPIQMAQAQTALSASVVNAAQNGTARASLGGSYVGYNQQQSYVQQPQQQNYAQQPQQQGYVLPRQSSSQQMISIPGQGVAQQNGQTNLYGSQTWGGMGYSLETLRQSQPLQQTQQQQVLSGSAYNTGAYQQQPAFASASKVQSQPFNGFPQQNMQYRYQ